MRNAAWIVLLACSIASGGAVCAAMVLPRRRDVMALVAGFVMTIAALGALGWIAYESKRFDVLAAGLFITVAATLGGFALGSSLTSALTRAAPAAPPAEFAEDDGRVLAVLLADAEPDEYDAAEVTASFDDLEASEIPLPPDAARVFAYVAEKTRYSSVGSSPSRATVRALADGLAHEAADRGTADAVVVAYCRTPPRLADVVAECAALGTRRFIVATLGVARTRQTDAAERALVDLGLDRMGVQVEYAEPLWTANSIADLVCRRVLHLFDGEPVASDGVVLVQGGQPWQWERSHPLAGEHETYFCQRVRAGLITSGVVAENVRTAYLDWEEPDVEDAVRHLVAVGCTRVAVSPAAMPFDSLATIVDLMMSVRESTWTADTEVTVLPAWGAETEVVDALVRVIGDAREDLDAREPRA